MVQSVKDLVSDCSGKAEWYIIEAQNAAFKAEVKIKVIPQWR